MSEPDANTIPGAVSRLGQSLISALPPAFLLLVVINAIFIGMVMWFLDEQISQRTALVEKIVDHCLLRVGDVDAVQARVDALEHDIRSMETGRK